MAKTKPSQRKITIWVPTDLLDEALAAGQGNITSTVKQGLALIAASRAFTTLKGRRGKFKSPLSVTKLRSDRR